jgi:excisionase family DNA binding protein
MNRRPTTTGDDPYDALADALRGVVEDVVSRIVAAMQPMTETDAAVTVSVAEGARRMGISVSKLKQLLASGEVRSLKVGDRRLIPVSALEAFARTEDLNSESCRIHVVHAAKRVRSPGATTPR